MCLQCMCEATGSILALKPQIAKTNQLTTGNQAWRQHMPVNSRGWGKTGAWDTQCQVSKLHIGRPFHKPNLILHGHHKLGELVKTITAKCVVFIHYYYYYLTEAIFHFFSEKNTHLLKLPFWVFLKLVYDVKTLCSSAPSSVECCLHPLLLPSAAATSGKETPAKRSSIHTPSRIVVNNWSDWGREGGGNQGIF